ncbi:MAG: GNAT family N-acetyltransferase [Candidatus Magasanikbacteria bacterium]
MNYSVTTKNINPQEAIDLYSKLGWGDKEDYSQEEMREALENTTFIAAARKESKLVGLLRAFSDDIYHTVLVDVVVDPEYQDQGVGSKLVKKLQQKYSHTPIFVNNFDETEEFFKKCGFEENKFGQLVWHE